MTFKEHQKLRFNQSVKRLQCLIDLNAPDVVLAGAFILTSRSAEGAFGKELSEEMYHQNQQYLRDRNGFCQYCDNRINPGLTHPPECEHCDAKMESQADEMEKQMEDYDKEGGPL